MPTFHKVLPDERLQSAQLDCIELYVKITAAKTVSQFMGASAPAIFVFDAGDSSQTAVDTLLGTASDITYATSFGSTALGSNAFGFVVKHGKAKKAIYATVQNYQSAGGTPAVDAFRSINGAGADTTALANTLTDGFAVTAAGNLYGRYIGNSNLDATTAGTILIRLFYSE